MEIKKKKGIINIILEDDEKINVRTSADLYELITLNCTNGGLTITGNSNIVNKIYGEGFLEKVYIPPVMAKEEIIAKCDEWLNCFYQIHDTLKALALTPKYRDQKILMRLDFNDIIYKNGTKKKEIKLYLSREGVVVITGISIEIPEDQLEIYLYLVANVIEHYLDKNYRYNKVETDYNWNHTLYSNYSNKETRDNPILSSLSLLYENHYYARVIDSIIANKNLQNSYEQINNTLKDEIISAQLDESFNLWIERAKVKLSDVLKIEEDEKQKKYGQKD